ncbi:MAG: hypothetical protein IT342_25040 [Candidatus Melainabacteria bacterium]|nr:hypothetical protein [Candidatus Melainabacteria bacterium]
MIKLTRYGMENGVRFGDNVEELSRLAALGALTSFLSAGKMTACLNPRDVATVDGPKATSLLFWRDGPLNEEFAHFEGTAEEIAELAEIFRLNNDNDELREALRQRLCSETLPNLLWMRTAPSVIGGPSYRAIVLMYMAGIKDAHEYTHTSGVVHNVAQLVAALELWQDERDAGRETGLWEILKPPAKAA